MARRTKVQIEADEAIRAERQSRIDRLVEYDLELRGEIRFRQRGRKNWQKGKALYVNSDDSIGIIDADGRMRDIRPEGIEKKEEGPRGGTIWTQVTGRV